MNSSVKWVWLAQRCGHGNEEIINLLDKMPRIDDIYSADFDTYIEIGISERLAYELSDKSLDSIYPIISFCQTSGVGILCYDSPSYPKSLRTLKNPPIVLYYVGKLPDFNSNLCISVVGTRKMSEYGMRAAYKIAYEIAASGAIVVSGMALGIDGIAACAAISAKGKTVAVLGCGIDIVYPKEHFKLKEIIKKNGAVITEYPPSTEPRGMNFPIRNRIISGLSQGTVVVDADMSSGAMITAKSAILQGRDVYAVPGNIDAQNTSGTNSLIRDGAQAVLCGADVIKNYSYLYRDSLNVQKLVNSEKQSEFSPEAVRKMGVGMRTRGAQIQSEPKIRLGYKSDKGQEKATSAVETPDNSKNNKSYDGLAQKLKEKESSGGDNSAQVLASLSEKQIKIFEEMPIDRAVTIDYLTCTGFSLGEVISALTVLEIKGLVSSLPGALYIRK